MAIQRKGRSDDLKSFDEMEKMTSEPEEMELPQNQDEEQTPVEAQGKKILPSSTSLVAFTLMIYLLTFLFFFFFLRTFGR